MKRFFSTFPFYSILLSVYPILFLVVNNITIISPISPIRPLLVSFLLANILLIYFYIALKNIHRSAMIVLILELLFFSFGHITNLLPTIRAIQLLLLFLILFLLMIFLVARQKEPEKLTLSLNVIALVIFLSAVFPIGFYSLKRIQSRNAAEAAANILPALRNEIKTESHTSTPPNPPDVVYIILDSYEGAEALEKYYIHDNKDFLDELASRGFYIVEDSRSNYLTTTYSLASSLNMIYINDLPYDLFTEMITNLQTNHVVDFLRANSYQYVHFPSGYKLTDDVTPDVWATDQKSQYNVSLTRPALTEFEVMVLKTTIFRLYFDNQGTQTQEKEISEGSNFLNRNFDDRRQLIENVFTNLPDYTANNTPEYIFAHMVLPHNPYLYNSDGSVNSYDGREELLGDLKNPQNNIRLYLEQLQYTNRRILQLIDQIQQNATNPPIIIIQADHGHDTFFDFEHPTPEGVDLRSSILNVIYFPDQDYSTLYPGMTPVNTFRIIFNKYFGTSYPLLNDTSYLHPRRTANSINSKQVFESITPYLEELGK